MELIFATANLHKLEEASAILGDGFTLIMPKELGRAEDIPETGATLEENSMQKCQAVVQMFGRDCFADDTGLEIEALGGAPGVHSARYADNWQPPFKEAEAFAKLSAQAQTPESKAIPLEYRKIMLRLLYEMEQEEKKAAAEGRETNRRGRLRTVITVWYNGKYYTFEGSVNGTITRKMQGVNGFGYDAVFMPDGFDCTIAQMTQEQKNALSHRSVALRKLADFFKDVR